MDTLNKIKGREVRHTDSPITYDTGWNPWNIGIRIFQESRIKIYGCHLSRQSEFFIKRSQGPVIENLRRIQYKSKIDNLRLLR